MARSTYVYVLQGAYGDIVAAFTVKHEMLSWAERNGGIDRFVVTRLRDGGKV